MIQEAAVKARPRANPHFLIENIWEALIGTYSKITHTLDRPLPPLLDSGLKHRILIHRALHEQAVKIEPETREAKMDLASHAAGAIRTYIEGEIVPTRMIDGQKLIYQHLLHYVPENDKDISPCLPTPSENPALHGL